MTIVALFQFRVRRVRRANARLKVQVAQRTQHLEAEIAERKRTEAALLSAQSDLEVLNEKLQELALTDALTGLPNRRAFEQALADSMQQSEGVSETAVLFLDLNGFKSVNDTYGHDAGDELIRVIGKRLHTLARTSDFVARLGGDEFVIVANQCDRNGARDVAQRVNQSIANTVSLSCVDVSVQVTASVGIACCPEHANTAGELMRKADVAMYHAKRVARVPMAFIDEVSADAVARQAQGA